MESSSTSKQSKKFHPLRWGVLEAVSGSVTALGGLVDDVVKRSLSQTRTPRSGYAIDEQAYDLPSLGLQRKPAFLAMIVVDIGVLLSSSKSFHTELM